MTHWSDLAGLDQGGGSIEDVTHWPALQGAGVTRGVEKERQGKHLQSSRQKRKRPGKLEKLQEGPSLTLGVVSTIVNLTRLLVWAREEGLPSPFRALLNFGMNQGPPGFLGDCVSFLTSHPPLNVAPPPTASLILVSPGPSSCCSVSVCGTEMH